MRTTDGQVSPENSMRASFHTLGCRLNQAETASISATFANRGYRIVDYGADTDVCVINTCSVTESAEAKCRQAVRTVLRRSPNAYVVVTGCYAQVGKEALRGIDGLDLIVGTAHKMQVVDLIDTPQKEAAPRVVHTTKIARDDFSLDVIGNYSDHTRANLKIQDGCSFACAFCIIPFSRGGARSRKFPDILQEARGLVARGHREIVLTGVNIGTYTSDGYELLQVIRALEDIDGLDRIRISSIEPTTIPEGLVDWMATSSKLCPYLHVPLQSGDDDVLQRMKRRYTRADFTSFIERVAARVPDVCLGTDAMVGFPARMRRHSPTPACCWPTCRWPIATSFHTPSGRTPTPNGIRIPCRPPTFRRAAALCGNSARARRRHFIAAPWAARCGCCSSVLRNRACIPASVTITSRWASKRQRTCQTGWRWCACTG